MAMKPELPYKRNPIQNAVTQAKAGDWPKQVGGAKTKATYGPKKTRIQGAKTQRD